MKDTIKSNFINNRKIITEVRYLGNPLISDLKGKIIEGINNEEIISPFKWKFGLGDVTINNGNSVDEIRETVFFDLHRLTYINSDFSTNQIYCDRFNKIFKVFKNCIGKENLKIIRIGCRIQGTYSSNKKSFDEILEGFLKIFPEKFLIDNFEPKDLLFQINYENGMYNIGPVKLDDPFLRSNFKYEDRNESIGFAIDTDNYASKGKEDKTYISDAKVKDVIMASISVEKFLFEKLNSL